jgi:hypothetical protein
MEFEVDHDQGTELLHRTNKKLKSDKNRWFQ